MKNTKDPNRCEAAVWGNFRHDQCQYRHKFAVTVRANHWHKVPGDPFEVKVCGFHKRNLEKGSCVYAVTGLWDERFPYGFETDCVVLAGGSTGGGT